MFHGVPVLIAWQGIWGSMTNKPGLLMFATMKNIACSLLRGGEGRGDFCLCNAWFMQDPIAERPSVLSSGALDPNRPACKGIRRTNSTQHAIKQTRHDLADRAQPAHSACAGCLVVRNSLGQR